MPITEVWQVRYVGADDKVHKALAFQQPTQSKNFKHLLIIDNDTGVTSWTAEGGVPHSELADGDAQYSSAGYGHTWHFAAD